MTLKLNGSYKTATGYLIPRSHFRGEKNQCYCVVQILTGGESHYTSRHTTMSTKELRKALKIGQKERIEIV